MIVVGGGAAGLAAAASLARAGRAVTLIEARPRVGGRVWTTREASDVVELGAEFVHGEAEAVVRVARAARLRMVEVADDHLRLRPGARGPARDARFWEKLEAIFARLPRGGADVSFAEALAKMRASKASRDLARAFVEGFHAARAEAISARALADEAGGGEDAKTLRRMIDGYDGVTEWLRARVEAPSVVRTGVVVTDVRWSRGRVRVRGTTATGRAIDVAEAPRAVVAVPLAVLARGADEPYALRFDPPLADKARAISRLATGHVVKIVLRFREPFWQAEKRLAKLAFLHAPREPFPTWWSDRPLLTPVLVGWTGGPSAESMRTLGPTFVLDAALGSLARAMKIDARDVESQLVSAAWHDWSSDPLSRGAYSYPLVGGAGAARALAEPIAGTLFFAGEHTCPPPGNGTVHGAIASGERAAREILSA